jgi:hypothetical protein
MRVRSGLSAEGALQNSLGFAEARLRRDRPLSAVPTLPALPRYRRLRRYRRFNATVAALHGLGYQLKNQNRRRD